MSLILPQHEQLLGSHVLPHRLEEYVLDGQPPTQDRNAAIRVAPQTVLDAICGAQMARSLMAISPRYFVATCFHEAGCENEFDTEVATRSSPQGFQSVGAFQIGEEEARRYHYELVNMLDLGKAADCMVQLAEDNLHGIVSAMDEADKLGRANSTVYVDPHGVEWVDGGLRAYLAIAHNHGMGYVRLTIHRYGLDWARYKARNPLDLIVKHGYGEDCVTGGYWYEMTRMAKP